MTEEIRAVTPIDELELALFSRSPEHDVEIPVIHSFTPGVYTRQMHVPAGTIFTGAKHLTDHHFILVEGIIEVLLEASEERVIYKAPYMGITKAGTKRAAYSHTNVVWMTVHANPDDIMDPDVLMEKILEPYSNPLIENKEDPRVNLWKTSNSPNVICFNGEIQPLKVS